MANYCISNYVVEGKREVLDRIRVNIQMVQEKYEADGWSQLNLVSVLSEIGVEIAGYIGVASNWMDAKLEEIGGQTVLTFREEYKWNCSCNMEMIAQLPQFKDDITAVYRYSEEPGCGIYETTDKDRKYFTDEYIRSLGFEPEEIKDASGIPAEQFREIAQQIIANREK